MPITMWCEKRSNYMPDPGNLVHSIARKHKFLECSISARAFHNGRKGHGTMQSNIMA
jgi:hypothetical protein